MYNRFNMDFIVNYEVSYILKDLSFFLNHPVYLILARYFLYGSYWDIVFHLGRSLWLYIFVILWFWVLMFTWFLVDTWRMWHSFLNFMACLFHRCLLIFEIFFIDVFFRVGAIIIEYIDDDANIIHIIT
jgi:hypothetical protein